MKRNIESNKDERISGNDASKSMDNKRDVENSKDEKTDQDFPGYPHYPSKEDIMDKRTDSHRVDADVEKFAGGQNASGINQRFTSQQERAKSEAQQSSLDQVEPGGPDDKNSDNLKALNSKSDEIGTRQNISNEDLNNNDAPASENNKK